MFHIYLGGALVLIALGGIGVFFVARKRAAQWKDLIKKGDQPPTSQQSQSNDNQKSVELNTVQVDTPN